MLCFMNIYICSNMSVWARRCDTIPVCLSVCQTDRQTDKQTDAHTDRQTRTQTDRQAHRQTDTQTDAHTDRRTHRQTDKQTDRQTDSYTDRHTRAHTHRHLCVFCSSTASARPLIFTAQNEFYDTERVLYKCSARPLISTGSAARSLTSTASVARAHGTRDFCFLFFYICTCCYGQQRWP